MTIKHNKHAKLAKRSLGHFAPNEISWVGAPCSVIETWMTEFSDRMTHQFHTCLIDADHNTKTSGVSILESERIWSSSESNSNPFSDKVRGLRFDLALINGNHYPGENQVVFISKAKENSVKKRLDQLGNILCYILQDADDIHSFLPRTTANGNPIPIFKEETKNEAFQFLEDWMSLRIPNVHALILAGGQSSRMGTDKSKIKYNGLTAIERMTKKLPNAIDQTFISTAEKNQDISNNIQDKFIGLGPMGAIASAFLTHPNHAFLVVACDLPLLKSERLEQLMQSRNPSKVATAFRLDSKPFPEPLVALYEPKAMAYLLDFLLLGYSCPRKMLINSPIEELVTHDEQSFFNMNTPEDLSYVQSLIQ